MGPEMFHKLNTVSFSGPEQGGKSSGEVHKATGTATDTGENPFHSCLDLRLGARKGLRVSERQTLRGSLSEKL